MHVVSVCLHYGSIIWLPWQRPNELENKVHIHHLPNGEKTEKIGPVCPEIFDYIRQFLAVSYLTDANKPCHLWSYQAKVHQIFRRCIPIISAVNAHS